MTGFSMGGMDAIMGRLDKVQSDIVKNGERGLQLAGRNTLNTSNRQVPHEEGDLERDGKVLSPEVGTVAVSYGHDPLNGVKAIVNHEDLSLKHDPGRNAKFLENAFNSERETNLQILGSQLKQGME